MKTATITLEYPVLLADGERSEITMRRPTMGDILDHPIKDERDFAGEMALLGKLCGLKPDDLRLLDAEDYTKLQGQFATFRAGSA